MSIGFGEGGAGRGVVSPEWGGGRFGGTGWTR